MRCILAGTVLGFYHRVAMSWRPPNSTAHPRSCLFNFTDLTVDQSALPSFAHATYGAHTFASSLGVSTFGLIRTPAACVRSWSLYERSKSALVVGRTVFTRLPTVHGQANFLRAAASDSSRVLQGARNHSWVEVVRRQVGGEGMGGYGCWAYPLLPPFASGSGIFVNVGRTLIVDGGPGLFAERTRHLHLSPGVPVPESRIVPPGLPTGCRRPPCGDNFVATAARRQGYDSVQFLFKTNFKKPYLTRHPELVLTHEACLGLDRVKSLGVCFPPGVPTRTGVAASRPCACLERHQFWLNCAGSPGYDNVSAS